MAKLIYGMGPTSLDGYVSERDGSFDWVMPGDDLHLHAGAEQEAAGTAIYGRKMYDLLVYWETADRVPDALAADLAFARSWQQLDKVVVSTTLTEPKSERTRIVRSLSLDEVARLKAEATRPIIVAGPTTASPFLNAGLVDEVTAYYIPFVAGGGLPMFKDIAQPIDLELTEELALNGGYVFRRFAVKR